MAGCNFSHPRERVVWELYKYFNGGAQKSPEGDRGAEAAGLLMPRATARVKM